MRRTLPRQRRAFLRVVELDRRDVPASTFAALGSAAGGPPVITVQNPDGSALTRFLAFDSAFRGGVNAAAAELDGDDSTVEVVAGAGTGGVPVVQIFRVDSDTGAVETLSSFMAFPEGFTGGVTVAAGDLGPDATPAIVTGAGRGGLPVVRAFAFNGPGTPLAVAAFFGFDPAFAGGVSVAVGDFDGIDGNGDQLAVGAGPGGGPQVNVFDQGGNLTRGFFAFAPEFRGGVTLGAGGAGTGFDNLLVGAGPGGAPLVSVFGSDGGLLNSFNAFDPSFRGGVGIGAATPSQLVVNALGRSGAVTGFDLTSLGTVTSQTQLAAGRSGLGVGFAPFGSGTGGAAGFLPSTFVNTDSIDPFSLRGFTINRQTPVGTNLLQSGNAPSGGELGFGALGPTTTTTTFG